jgi:hypothetical protein
MHRHIRRRRGMRRRIRSRPRSLIVTPLVPASEAQRIKVAGLPCLVCGKTPADPAHLVPQRIGGCSHPDCVVPLCRAHHRAYDRFGFALARHLGDEWHSERAHAIEHATGAELERALRGEGWAR